jgi:hypothetical protein
MMEAARTTEMLVNFYQITQRYNPEDGHQSKKECVFNYLFNVTLNCAILFIRLLRLDGSLLNILMLENMKDGNWFMQMVLIPCFNIVHS